MDQIAEAKEKLAELKQLFLSVKGGENYAVIEGFTQLLTAIG